VCGCRDGFTGSQCEIKDDSSGKLPIVDAGSLASIEHEGVCAAWGSNHYVSFDGKQFYYPGRCAYKLAFECSGVFSVTVSYDK